MKVNLVSPEEFKNLVLNQEFVQHAALALLVLADWKTETSLIQPEANHFKGTLP